ncbi:hypothetical protein WJX79_009585 [Trebouxia sp. C0005]
MASKATNKLIKLGWIGAGGINFGSLEGPWNHAVRMQKQNNVQFTAVVDPNVTAAQKRIEQYQQGPYAKKWEGCQAFKDHQSMLQSAAKPEGVIIGVPPAVHGSLDIAAKAMEVDIAKAGLHMLVEKPISMRPAEEVERLAQVLDQVADEKSLIIAVGYMLRSSPAVVAAKRLMQEIGVTPASIVGRYSCPYNNIAKPQWWDTQKSGGCIVEQATHFVDLMRYLSGGDIIQESIQAVAVGPDMALKEMPAHPQAEHLVPMERRNNRATMATFKMTTGAIACLSHTLLLHGSDFFSAMDITGDGYHIIIHDPYQNPSLQVRRPFTNHYEQVHLNLDQDMYENQFDGWLEAIRTGNKDAVKCHYHDAAQTYKASWDITEASGAAPPGTDP